MEKAIIMTGKINSTESYQLLVGLDYVGAEFSGSSNREEFYDELSTAFVERIFKNKSDDSVLEVGATNGLRINPETIRSEKIEPLEVNLAEQFSELVCKKLIQASTNPFLDNMRN